MQSIISQNDPLAPVIFGVTLILCCALLGRFAARKFGQPTMLGELLMGIFIGNVLYLTGYDLIGILREGATYPDMAKLTLEGNTWDEAANMVLGAEAGRAFLDVLRGPMGGQYLQMSQAVDVFARYGVIFLLFHLGLGASVAKLRQAQADSWRVALLGVFAPFVLGFLAVWLFSPDASQTQRLFLAAILVATSIGITAQVLDTLRLSNSPEARTILNAAVIDDVLGLILLAIATAVAITGVVSIPEIARISVVAGLFLITALLGGPYFLKFLGWFLRPMDVMEAKLFISFVLVMILAVMANLLGVLSFVGAFGAGLLMLDSDFKEWGREAESHLSIRELLAPIEAILIPVFFVLMGIQVKLELFLDWQVVTFALGLIFAALAGKLISGIVASGRIRRLSVGIGMMPRREVGLAFASIGKAAGVIDAAMFSALILLVIVSTLLTSPLLRMTLGRNGGGGWRRSWARLLNKPPGAVLNGERRPEV